MTAPALSHGLLVRVAMEVLGHTQMTRAVTHLPRVVRPPHQRLELGVELALDHPRDVQPGRNGVVAAPVSDESPHDPITVKAPDVAAVRTDTVDRDPEVYANHAG